jgi:hypothetical protein
MEPKPQEAKTHVPPRLVAAERSGCAALPAAPGDSDEKDPRRVLDDAGVNIAGDKSIRYVAALRRPLNHVCLDLESWTGDHVPPRPPPWAHAVFTQAALAVVS